MLCLVNAFRAQHGLRALHLAAPLVRVARTKAHDIVECGAFSHTPCGRAFAAAFAKVGYTTGNWSIGENLAWGSGDRASAAAAMDGFVHSPEHRAILLGRWHDIGIALWQGSLFGHAGVSLWVLDFGRHS